MTASAVIDAPRSRRRGQALGRLEIDAIERLSALGLSQQAVAKAVGCSRPTVQRWLQRLAQGQRQPRRRNAERYAASTRARIARDRRAPLAARTTSHNPCEVDVQPETDSGSAHVIRSAPRFSDPLRGNGMFGQMFVKSQPAPRGAEPEREVHVPAVASVAARGPIVRRDAIEQAQALLEWLQADGGVVGLVTAGEVQASWRDMLSERGWESAVGWQSVAVELRKAIGDRRHHYISRAGRRFVAYRIPLPDAVGNVVQFAAAGAA
jgi:transcriptional regulator with XRE-family HTH domain